MRRFTAILLTALMLVVSCIDLSAAGTSISLANNGFEEGSSGWTTTYAQLNIVGNAQSGAQCGEIVMSQAYGRAMYKYQFIKGVRYRVSVYVKIKEGYNTANLVIDHRNFGDKSLIKSAVQNVHVNSQNWTKLTGIYEFSGVGTGEAYIYVRIGDALTPVTFYMDSLGIEYYDKIPAPVGQTVIAEGEMATNGGFDEDASGYTVGGAKLNYISRDGAENTLGCGMVTAYGSCAVGQTAVLDANTKYRISAYVKTQRGNMDFDTAIAVKGGQDMTFDKYIKDYSYQTSNSVPKVVGSYKDINTKWKKITTDFVWRGDEKEVYVYIRANAQAGSVFYIDNFSIIPIGTVEEETISTLKKSGVLVDGFKATDVISTANGRVLASIKPVAQALNAEYVFDSKTGTVNISKNFYNIKIDTKNKMAVANNAAIPLPQVYMVGDSVVTDVISICGALNESAVKESDELVSINSHKASGRLFNLAKAMIEKKSAKIGFVGGGVTAGYGASLREKDSYRSLVMSWLRNRYTDCSFTEINNAISTTNSELEVYRIDEVLEENPDVIFVDFCPEDALRDAEDIKKSLNSLVYAIRQKCPNTDIIFLESWSDDMSESYLAGTSPVVIDAYDAVAKSWGLSVINMGQSMFDLATKNNQTMEDNYTLYLYYPNDAGHKYYADMICEFVEEGLKNPVLLAKSDEIDTAKLIDGRIVHIESAKNTGFEEKTSVDGLAYFEGDVGDELTLKFNGTSVGAMWMIGFDTGSVEYAIDGVPMGVAVAFDEHSVRTQKVHYTVFKDDLKPGEHTLTIRVAKDKNIRSLGNKIKLVDFIVGNKAE